MLPSARDSVFGVLISPIYPPTPHDLDRFSHLGGLPSLPPGVKWLRAPNGMPFHFLAQIDLAEVPASGIVDFRGSHVPEFPREGALYFFADCATFGIWEQPEASHRVLYAPDRGGARPVQPPSDLMPHNTPDAGVLANTHATYFPHLRPRPMVLLPHVPISLTDMASTPALSEAPRDGRGIHAPWTGYELHGDWRMPLLETGFPWRWLLLERIAISVATAAAKQEWPGDIRENCIAWHQRASTESPLARVPTEVADELCNWLRNLAARGPDVRFYAGLCFGEAIRAAWAYIAFSGDLSDIPSQLVQDLRPMDRLTAGDGHHKMLGDAISVQNVQLADENNVLLVRLDSDETLDFCWGDAGILHIAVPRADLAARNFARTHLNADCS